MGAVPSEQVERKKSLNAISRVERKKKRGRGRKRKLPKPKFQENWVKKNKKGEK